MCWPLIVGSGPGGTTIVAGAAAPPRERTEHAQIPPEAISRSGNRFGTEIPPPLRRVNNGGARGAPRHRRLRGTRDCASRVLQRAAPIWRRNQAAA
jgi:hypothetical protein